MKDKQYIESPVKLGIFDNWDQRRDGLRPTTPKILAMAAAAKTKGKKK